MVSMWENQLADKLLVWQACVGCCGAVRALGKSSRLFIFVYVFGRPHEEVGFANVQVQRCTALWVTQEGA